MAEIKRYGRPNERTVGEIGDIYTNTNTNEQFKCVDTYEIRTHDGIITYYVWISTRVNTGDSGNSGGNGSGGDTIVQPSPTIIDVYELPTENINENVFYRLTKGVIYVGTYGDNDKFIVRCVETLPETGIPVTIGQTNLDIYYSKQDNEVYGYIDTNLSAMASVPVGWYDLVTLAPLFDVEYAGIVFNKNALLDDGKFRVLIEHPKYEYKNSWRELPDVYQTVPEIDIRWNGDIGDRFTLDLSMLGYNEGIQLAKVSDIVPSRDQVVEGRYWNPNGDEYPITDDLLDEETFPGGLNVNNVIHVVYSQSELNAALGFPDGTISNGIYFLLDASDPTSDPWYVSRFTSYAPVSTLDPKFLPDEIGGEVHWDDIVTDRNYIRYDLGVYSKSEVDSLISNAIGTAIGTAIGGSY